MRKTKITIEGYKEKLRDEWDNGIDAIRVSDKSGPYIEYKTVQTILKYNPNFGDNKVCTCGHSYYRHFDSYEGMRACGCKYCRCIIFKEKNEDGNSK